MHHPTLAGLRRAQDPAAAAAASAPEPAFLLPWPSAHGTRCALALVVAALLAPAQAAGLGMAEAAALARQQSPALTALQASLSGSTLARPAAASLPDPRLSIGLENIPVQGPDRYNLTRDAGTMQRLALMQEMPNLAKREARSQLAQARIERDRLQLAAAELGVRREALRAWVAVYYAQQRAAWLDRLQQQNTLLQQTLPPRIAAGAGMAAELTMARQEALEIADRQDEVARDLAKARAALRRLVGPRGDEALVGEPLAWAVEEQRLREELPRHTDLAPYDAMAAMAQAEIDENRAETRGDWSWEVAWSRRQRYDDMVSFQLSFDLPVRQAQRQTPQIAARRQELTRIAAEREDLLRRRAEEVETQLAELRALDAQAARLQGQGLALADERVALTLAAYQAGRGELGTVLAARSALLELHLRALALDAERSDLRVRLNTWIAE
ncbi:MAG: TolC family protein [Rubrivivax sp.]|nr:TolC family protein [Rubrivivax sp.]